MKLKLQNVVLKNTEQQMVKYNSIATKVSFYDFFKQILSKRASPRNAWFLGIWITSVTVTKKKQ